MYSPRIYSYSHPRYPLVIVLRWRGFLDRTKNGLLIFLHFVFCLKAKLDYWYMPLYVRIYVLVEIIQISGQATECVYTWAWYTYTHSRSPTQEQPKSWLPYPLSFLFLFRFPLRYLHPVPLPFILSGYCSCHTSQVSFICYNFSFYTLYS